MSLNDRAMNPYYGNSLVSLPSGDGVIAIGGIGERLEGPCCKYPTRLFLLKFTTRNFNEHIWVELSQRPKSPRQDFDTRMFFLNLNAFNCTTLG